MNAVPEHITPESLTDMSTTQIEEQIEHLKVRRLSSVVAYEKGVAIKKATSDEHARETLGKQLDMLAKNFLAIDKAVTSAETRVQKIRILRLELGLE